MEKNELESFLFFEKNRWHYFLEICEWLKHQTVASLWSKEWTLSVDLHRNWSSHSFCNRTCLQEKVFRWLISSESANDFFKFCSLQQKLRLVVEWDVTCSFLLTRRTEQWSSLSMVSMMDDVFFRDSVVQWQWMRCRLSSWPLGRLFETNH